MAYTNTMAYQNILVETNSRISVLTINRPDKRNALNQATRDEIRQALDSLERSPESRVLVITGTGDKAFIAGADINEFEGRTGLMQHDAMKGLRVFDAIEEFPKPVIAMINGFCLGGGLETAQTKAVDHRDHRLGKLLDRIENADPFHRIVLHQGSPALKFVDIGSGNKRLVPGSRDNQDARFRRSLKRIQRLTNLIACRLIQSVSLVGPVDG